MSGPSTIWTELRNVPYGVKISFARRADNQIIIATVGRSVRPDASVIEIKVSQPKIYTAKLPDTRIVNVNLEDRPLLPGSSLP